MSRYFVWFLEDTHWKFHHRTFFSIFSLYKKNCQLLKNTNLSHKFVKNLSQNLSRESCKKSFNKLCETKLCQDGSPQICSDKILKKILPTTCGLNFIAALTKICSRQICEKLHHQLVRKIHKNLSRESCKNLSTNCVRLKFVRWFTTNLFRQNLEESSFHKSCETKFYPNALQICSRQNLWNWSTKCCNSICPTSWHILRKTQFCK